MTFPLLPLSEVTEKIGSGSTPRGGDSVYIASGTSLIRSQNIYNSKFYDSGLAFIDEKIADKMKGVTVFKDDVLLNITGDSVARCCKVKESILPARVNQHVAIIRSDKKVLNPDFLMFYLTSPYMQAKLLSWAGTGGTRKALTKGMIEGFEVPVPEIHIQNKISEKLNNYNDLIENNRRRIQLLEESVRLLYKEWFVQLRFPGHEHVKITNGVPEGWGLKKIGDVCESLEDGDWVETKDQGGKDYRIVQISNIGDNSFKETGNPRYVTEETFKRLRCRELVSGDILISRMPKPIGRGWLVTEMPFKMITIVDAAIAKPNLEIVNSIYFLYHINSEPNISLSEKHAAGATRPRISKKNLSNLPIKVPSKELMEVFASFAKVNLREQVLLRKANIGLTKARDILLPRLMNGDLEV